MSTLYDLLKKMPRLKKKKSPGWAGVIGFAFGGLGLAIYFWSWVDCVACVLLAILAGILVSSLGHAGVIGGALVAGGYGIFRAITSNEALEAEEKS